MCTEVWSLYMQARESSHALQEYLGQMTGEGESILTTGLASAATSCTWIRIS